MALSLGLVGDLSIVRFRTPIKEPEELAYLFISIAIGLGLGAGQTVATVVAGLGILLVIALLRLTRRGARSKNLHLSIDWQDRGEGQPERYLERLNEVISKHTKTAELRRLDTRQESIEATYIVNISSIDELNSLVGELRNTFVSIGVTFLDQNNLPSI